MRRVRSLRAFGAGRGDHAGADGVVRRLVDEDEAAGRAVVAVRVEEDRLGRAQAGAADLVEREAAHVRFAFECVDVVAVLDRGGASTHAPGRVLEPEGPAGRERAVFAHPADGRVELLCDRRRMPGVGDHAASRDIEVVAEPQGHGAGRRGLFELPIERVDRRDLGRVARGQHDHLVARAKDAAGDAAGVAAVVGMPGGHRADHDLHGEAAVFGVVVGTGGDFLEVAQQRGRVAPRHVRGRRNDVVAGERGQRDRSDIVDVEAARERRELVADRLEGGLPVTDEVHLVHAQHQLRDAEQRGEEGVAPRLLHDARAGVDEDQREIGGGGAGDHVAGVLHVAGRVRDDELPPRRREIAVGDIDGDALLALGAETVRQQCEVDVVEALLAAGALDRLELVLEDPFRVVEQPPDQGALPVVDGAGGDEAQQFHG